MSQLADYHEAVAYVESFSNISLRNNYGRNKKDASYFIRRTQYFLNLLGNPEHGFKYIHITGTAGKGTVSTMIHEVLTVSGKKTGLFTSPYVTTTIEKIKVQDKYISPKEFVRLVNYLRPFIKRAEPGIYGVPSAFELCFIITLLYFKKMKCEWVVLEVGVGGRYDATNVITRPVVTVITNIDYDHTEILGKTLSKIANDKAGIIKAGSTFFTSEQRPALQRIFRKYCRKEKIASYFIKPQKSSGDYNQKLVMVIAEYLSLSERDVSKGISLTKLACRFETINDRPLVILDGAHNRAKIRSTIANLKKYSFNKLYLLLTIADTNKDHEAILEPLLSLPYNLHLTLTQVKNKDRRSVYPGLLIPIIKKYMKKNAIISVVEDPSQALAGIMKMAKKGDLILVTGSFFLAGEVRKKWITEEWVLKNRKSFKS